MAKNVLSLQLLRNSTLFNDKAAAIAGITGSSTQDGVIKLARYTEGTATATIFGIYHDATMGGTSGYTIYDSYHEVIESIKDQIADLSDDTTDAIDEIEAKLGTGVTDSNTVTDQLEALSGDAQSSSADTSVEGAKKYADEKIAEAVDALDYTGVTTGDAVVITNVTETDGVVSATPANVGNLKLADYVSGSSSGAVAATDTINEAFGKVENQIANLESGSSEEIEEIKNRLGNDVTTANTVSDQLAALSGTAGASSADTSVEGAKSYADAKIGQAVSGLDYTDTAVTGQYVSAVNEVDGVIAVTREALPSVADSASAKTFVTSVSETNGQIAVTKGTVSSTGNTVVLTDNADGGINIEVASSALIEYVGDNETIEVSAAVNNQKTISSLLTLTSVTPSSTTVKEEYALVDASGNTKGQTVKIYKDSSLVSIEYITDTGDTHYQNLKYVYVDNSGNTNTEYVDMSTLVLEAEFASGVTVDASGVAHGVVDTTSENFLTVGADGFKLSGVQTAIDNAVSGATAQTAELSAKTVTEVGSSNSSITATLSAATDGTKHLDVITDASKVKMTGFTADASGFTGITTASTVTEAVKTIETEFLANEQTTAQALNDLEQTKLETIVVNGVTGTTTTGANPSASVTIDGADITLDGYQKPAAAAAITSADTVNQAIGKLEKGLEAATSGGITGATVNNAPLAVTNNVLTQTVAGKQTEATATSNEAIVVETDANGNLTLGLAYLDAGTY